MIPTADMFPLCHVPECDAWLRDKVECSVDFLLNHVPPDSLDAIILTGSTARGEASVLTTGQGFRLLGDLEFLVIVRAPFDWRQLRQQMAVLSHRATQEIGADGREAIIEYGPAGRIYLQRNIRPCIFAYDLRTHGKVVRGQPDILADIAPFEVGDIPSEDALNLLMNRLLELLLDAKHEAASSVGLNGSSDKRYRTAKLVLELAGSALASTGNHVSQCHKRSENFARLVQAESTLATALSDIDTFQSQLNAAIAYKLAPNPQQFAGISPSLTQCVQWGLELWQWQIRRLLGGNLMNFHDALHAYVRRERLGTRCKGWIKLIRHPLRPQGALSWTRAMRLQYASPQTLTYAVALLMLAGLNGASSSDWEPKVRRLSPIPFDSLARDQLANAIGELWTWLIRNN